MTVCQLIALWPYKLELGFVVLALEGSQPNIQPTEQVVLVVKNPPANAGDIRDLGSIPGLGRCPREEHGNPLQYPCLENPTDRGAWQATVHGVAKSWTRLEQLSEHVCARACAHTQTHRIELEFCQPLQI